MTYTVQFIEEGSVCRIDLIADDGQSLPHMATGGDRAAAAQALDRELEARRPQLRAAAEVATAAADDADAQHEALRAQAGEYLEGQA